MTRIWNIGGLVVLCGIVLLAVGCTTGKEVRYTPGEIQSFDRDVQERIRAGELSLNMTQPQVRLAWGPPHAVRTLPGDGGGVREEWEYQSMLGAVRTYLYFENGILNRLITGKPGLGFSGDTPPPENPQQVDTKEGSTGNAK